MTTITLTEPVVVIKRTNRLRPVVREICYALGGLIGIAAVTITTLSIAHLVALKREAMRHAELAPKGVVTCSRWTQMTDTDKLAGAEYTLVNARQAKGSRTFGAVDAAEVSVLKSALDSSCPRVDGKTFISKLVNSREGLD